MTSTSWSAGSSSAVYSVYAVLLHMMTCIATSSICSTTKASTHTQTHYNITNIITDAVQGPYIQELGVSLIKGVCLQLQLLLDRYVF
jgi:hypothetical protein